MEAAGTTADEVDGDRATEPNIAVKGSKPLHRFMRGEPKCLGIAILLFGCAELMMGLELIKDGTTNSSFFYTPFWQGALFLTCGILSIYTEVHLSKKMVTVCLSMYVVSLLGLPISFYYRIASIARLNRHLPTSDGSYAWDTSRRVLYRYMQLISVEAILLASSVCVSGLLIFLSTMARWALKSSSTQVVVQHALPPVLSDLTKIDSET